MGRTVRCLVPTCTSIKYWKQPSERANLHFFSFPKGREAQWADAIGTPEVVAEGRSLCHFRVCSDHFRKEDLEPNVAGKYFNLDYKQKLRPDVVPSLLLPGPEEVARSGVKKWGKLRKRKQVLVAKTDFEDEVGQDAASSPSSLKKEREAYQVEEDIPKEKCLICSEMTTASSLPNCKFDGGSESSLLNEQLWATFILRRILELPLWKFEDILKTAGPSVHPGKWFVVCDICSQGLVQITEIQKQVRGLEKKIDKLQEDLKEKFKNSLEESGEAGAGVCNVSQEIRRFLKCPVIQEPVPESEIKEEVDPDMPFEEADDDPLTPYDQGKDAEVGEEDDEEWRPASESGSECAYPLDQFEKGAKSHVTKQLKDVAASSRHSIEKRSGGGERDYPCDLCPRKYYSGRSLKSHLELHRSTRLVEGGRYDCSQCGVPYNSAASVKYHLRKKHRLYLHLAWEKSGEPQKDYLYSSTTKKAVFARITAKSKGNEDEDNLSGQPSSSTEEDPSVRKHPCKICPRKFAMKGNLQNHLRYHEFTKKKYNCRYDCARCAVPLPNFRTLQGHYRAKHKLRFSKLWEQEKSTSQEDYLSDPSAPRMKRSKPGKVTAAVTSKAKTMDKEICDICGFEGRGRQTMREHTFHHKMFDNSVDPSVSTTELICNICKALFKGRRQLIYHKVNSHAEELDLKVFKCSYCPQQFARKDAWMGHEMRIHKKVGKYPCDQCDYIAVTRKNLQTHMVKHSDSKFLCQYCSASYTYEEALHQHIRRYHPDKHVGAGRNYFVGVPVEKLSNEETPSYNFKMRKIQKEQKQLNCKYCESVLPHKLALNLHLRESHKDLYSFQCDMCDKAYLSHTSLQLHRKVNHMEKDKRVKCAWCLKTVAHRMYLYSHSKTCPKKPKDGNGPKIMVLEGEEVEEEGEGGVGDGQMETTT